MPSWSRAVLFSAVLSAAGCAAEGNVFISMISPQPLVPGQPAWVRVDNWSWASVVLDPGCNAFELLDDRGGQLWRSTGCILLPKPRVGWGGSETTKPLLPDSITPGFYTFRMSVVANDTQTLVLTTDPFEVVAAAPIE